MNREDRYKIISEEFGDLIIDNNRIPFDLSFFSSIAINDINGRYSVAYVPVESITQNSLYRFDYAAMPKCYGLMSVSSYESTTINQIPIPQDYNLTGKGVLLGFVDTGIDYRNQVFRYGDNSSKILSIWDQTIDSERDYPEGLYYGTEYKNDQINAALNSDNPLSLVPSMDDNGHGTMLAGIAGGSYQADNNYSGVAPDAEFVVVKLKPAKRVIKDFFQIPEDAVCYQGNDIMFGVKYLSEIARNMGRPIVICIGLGTSQGSHTGQAILAEYLTTIGDLAGTSVVIAAGNEGNSRHHYMGEIVPSVGYNDVELTVGDNETGFAMELWGYAPNIYSVDIYSPFGEFIYNIPTSLRQENTVQLNYVDTVILIDNRIVDPISGEPFILFRFINPHSGTWRLRVSSQGDFASTFHVWLPISNFITQGTFFVQYNTYTTITIPGNAKTPVTVSAYDVTTQSLYEYASRGFTKNNIPKPDIVAPGVNILTPTIDNQYISSSGTSIAAAYTTGAIATILEWSIINGDFALINDQVIQRVLTSSAKRFEDVNYPNPDWGYGILDMNEALKIVTLYGKNY